MASETTRKASHSLRLTIHHQTRPLLPVSLFASFIFCLAVTFCAGAAAAEIETDTAQYRATLLELLDTAGEILFIIDADSAGAVSESLSQLDQVTDDELRKAFMASMPLEQLQQYLLDLQPQLATVRYLDAMDTIDIPPINIEPPICELSNPGVAIAAQAVASYFEILMGAQKFVCLQEVLGENVALLCTVFDVIRATASNIAQEQNFCLAQKNLARNKAMLELTRGIGDQLNTFVDDVTLTSRASQDALDLAQGDLDSILSGTQDIQSALDSGYAQLDAQTADLMAALASLGDNLNGLASLINDINFRSTVNLAFLEDASLRVADLQERAADIQGDVEAITPLLADISSAGSQLADELESDWTRQQEDRIAADLGNPNANNPAHALPSSAGGELELAREIVINTIFSLQSLGTVDTSQALALVGMADENYNAGQYPEAYLALKQAYQSLDGLKEGR